MTERPTAEIDAADYTAAVCGRLILAWKGSNRFWHAASGHAHDHRATRVIPPEVGDGS